MLDLRLSFWSISMDFLTVYDCTMDSVYGPVLYTLLVLLFQLYLYAMSVHKLLEQSMAAYMAGI